MARSHVFFADSLVPSCRSVFDRFVVVVVFFSQGSNRTKKADTSKAALWSRCGNQPFCLPHSNNFSQC